VCVVVASSSPLQRLGVRTNVFEGPVAALRRGGDREGPADLLQEESGRRSHPCPRATDWRWLKTPRLASNAEVQGVIGGLAVQTDQGAR